SDLFKASEIVVHIAASTRLGSQLEPRFNNQLITTDYMVKVIERFKGRFESGTTMTLRVHGGRVDFPHLTSAEIQPKRLPLPRIGEQYIFFGIQFLDLEAFMPLFNEQGMFALSTEPLSIEQLVHPLAGIDSRLFSNYDGMPIEDFW